MNWTRVGITALIFCLITSFVSPQNDTEGSSPASAPVSSELPNVLLIVIDDLNDYVGFLGGHPQASTPNMDELAAQGTVFANAHTASTADFGARAALLYGISPARSGLVMNGVGDPVEVLPDGQTLPEVFDAAGYLTGRTGKVFPNWLSAFEKWDEPLSPTVGAVSFDEPLNGLNNELDWGIVDVPVELTRDYDRTTIAIDFLENISSDDGPFFLAIGYTGLNAPWYCLQTYFDQITEDTEDIISSPIVEDDLNDVGNPGVRWSQVNVTELMQQAGMEKFALHAYLACTAMLDDQIGQVLDALAESEFAENTIVALVSDQGYHLGEKQSWQNQSLWEETTHVPFVIRVPGGDEQSSYRQRVESAVSTGSLLPTLVELAGIQPPEYASDDALYHIDYESLAPLMDASIPESSWTGLPPATFYQLWHIAVRGNDFRYIRYGNGSEEFYDHRVDPNEWENLANQVLNIESYRQLADVLSLDPDAPDLVNIDLSLPEQINDEDVSDGEELVESSGLGETGEINSENVEVIPGEHLLHEDAINELKRNFGIDPASVIFSDENAPSQLQSSKQQPNVLFIVVDDLNDYVGFLGGHPQASTPNMDQLAEQGINFTNAYVASPADRSARVSFLTGMNPAQSGVTTNYSPGLFDLLPNVQTLPQIFDAADYNTIQIGHIFDPNDTRSGIWRNQFDRIDDTDVVIADPDDTVHWGEVETAADQQADFARVEIAHRYLQSLPVDNSSPFFMGIAFTSTQLPWRCPVEYYQRIAESSEDVILPTATENNLKAQVSAVEGYQEPISDSRYLEALQNYLACGSFVDDQIGRLLTALDQSAFADNTIVVLLSDQGIQFGEQTDWQKLGIKNQLTRVPFVIRMPGDSGQYVTQVEQPVSLSSVFATLIDLAEIDMPDYAGQGDAYRIDYRSLVPLMIDESS